MKEFTTIQELAVAKTRDEIITWAAEMQKCPYDYEGEAFGEDVCKEGADADQCNECWKAALTGIVCKGEEEPKRTTRKSKQQKAQEKADAEIMSHMSDPITGATNSEKKPEVESPDPNLAAKDSNEGVKALKVLALTMTKEEFLQNIKDNKICPSMYGFPDTMSSCQKHAIGSQCEDCWRVIVDSLEFKVVDDAHNAEDTQVVDTTELVAPVKNDVKVLAHMDKLVEEIKNFKAQQEQWDALLKEKIAEATAKVEEEKAKLQKAIDYNMSMVVVEFPQVEAKETKTQKKVSLVSGDVVLKKATEKIDYDKDKLLAYAKEKGMNDYIETKESFKWADFKKTLNIADGNIVDSDGVVLKVDGLSIVTTEEVLEVK